MKNGAIGKNICALSDKIKHRTGCVHPLEKLTGMQGSILSYLGEREREVYAKDIASDFGLSRATVSEYLFAMEQHKLVEVGEAENDRRLKKITLTPKGRTLSRHIRTKFKIIDCQMTKGLTDDDKKLLLTLLEKISDNLDELDK